MRDDLTEADVEAGKSPKGGWTRATLESWGVPWPPPAGWKDALTAKSRAANLDKRAAARARKKARRAERKAAAAAIPASEEICS